MGVGVGCQLTQQQVPERERGHSVSMHAQAASWPAGCNCKLRWGVGQQGREGKAARAHRLPPTGAATRSETSGRLVRVARWPAGYRQQRARRPVGGTSGMQQRGGGRRAAAAGAAGAYLDHGALRVHLAHREGAAHDVAAREEALDLRAGHPEVAGGWFRRARGRAPLLPEGGRHRLGWAVRHGMQRGDEEAGG